MVFSDHIPREVTPPYQKILSIVVHLIKVLKYFYLIELPISRRRKARDWTLVNLIISQYGEKLVVTSKIPNTPSVKLIDKTGRVYWSVSTDGQGQSLFTSPLYVTSDIERNTVTVTDWDNNTLTVLNGDTGDVIKRRSVKDNPEGVTTGPSGNIYVCYSDTREVAVLTEDLAEERILLSQQDGLGVGPYAITYDKISGHLITSYAWFGGDRNSVDIWELS